MMLASSDPANFILMISWVISCLACAGLAIYAYTRWRKHPQESLSMAIAVWGRRHSDNFIIGFILSIVLFFPVGVITGMFVGHWFWPVEIEVEVVRVPGDKTDAEMAEMLLAARRVEQYVTDHPDASLDEIEALTPERLAELYPEIK